MNDSNQFIIQCWKEKAVAKDTVPMLVICGQTGVGKTTIAKSLQKEINPEAKFTLRGGVGMELIASVAETDHVLLFDDISWRSTTTVNELDAAYSGEDVSYASGLREEKTFPIVPIIVTSIKRPTDVDILEKCVVVELNALA